MRIYLLSLLLTGILFPALLSAQTPQPEYVQTIQGTVVDKETQQPIQSVTVVVLNTDPIQGTRTDEKGRFTINNVTVGRHDIRIRHMGYKEQVLPNIMVNSGKQTILNIEMVETVAGNMEVEVKGQAKDKPGNEMAVVSARMFTVEETQRYAGSLGDPARMAANYAGVSGANDSRNDIIIRGNSPSGLLWRLEGVDIPSPNHFSAQGSTGGPVSILNTNLLRNSDFFTSAFPSEYGNALSGVFDLKMRNGNSNKYEFTGQLGFNGFELMAEGPISKANNSSFLASYRYSVLGFFQAVGLNLGPAGVPRYQDLSYKIYLPTAKAGLFEIFGIGGISTIEVLDSKRKEDNFSYGQGGSDIRFGSDMGVTGISHLLPIGKNGYWKNIASVSMDRKRTHVERFADNTKFNQYQDTTIYARISYHSILNLKLNPKNTLKSGIIFSRQGFDMIQRTYDTAADLMRTLSQQDGHTYLGQVYSQWKHDFNDRLSLLAGTQFSYLFLNKTYSIEPRAGIKYALTNRTSLNMGYGIHGQMQTQVMYFLNTLVDTPSRTYTQTNLDLGFTRSQHFVIGMDHRLGKDMRLKAETYYQNLYNVPVTVRPSSYSPLNIGADFGTVQYDSLVNKGTGFNYGFELTVEKFFSNSYFFLVTASIFDSKYKGSDGVLRNTAFNGTFTTNALIGKEIKVSRRGTITLSGKVTWAGGRHYTPVDTLDSRMLQSTIYQDDKAFTLQYPDYLKADIRIGFKLNSKKVTQEWALDVANVTNRKNVLMESYDPKTNTVRTEYQLGIFPMMLYRIQF